MKLIFRIGIEDNYLSVYPHKLVRVWGKKRHTMAYAGAKTFENTSSEHYNWVVFNLTDTQWGYQGEKHNHDYGAVGFCPLLNAVSVSYTANSKGKTLCIPQVWHEDVSEDLMKVIIKFSEEVCV